MRRRKQPQVDPFAGYQGPRVGGVAPPWSGVPQSRPPTDGVSEAGPLPSARVLATQGVATEAAVSAPPREPAARPATDVPPTSLRPEAREQESPPAKTRKPKRRDRRAELLGGAVSVSTHRSDLGTRLVRACLWGLLALLAVSVLGLVLHIGRTAGPQRVERQQASGAGAGGFAAVFMQRWLPAGQGSEGDLAPYMAEVPALENRPGVRFAGQTPVVLSSDRVAPGYWSVLVAVAEEVKDRHGTLRQAGTHWYRVGVAQAGSSSTSPGGGDTTVWQVVAPPFEVPAPVAAEPLTDSAYADTAVPTDGPIGDTAQHFLDAYLAGRGELDRYTTPGVALAPVTPPGARKVQVTSIAAVPVAGDVQDSTDPPGDGVTVRVLVHATVTSRDGVVSPMDYPLTLRSRAGRWEVLSLDPAPAVQLRSGVPATPVPSAGTSQPGTSAPTAP